MGNAPRALAISSGKYDNAGNLLPEYYTSDTMGSDGVLYTAGMPVIVMRNAYQGDLGANMDSRGNFKTNTLTGVGRVSFDLAASKSIEFMEGKRFEMRIDAQNILNHPTPAGSTAASNGGRNQSIGAPSLSISNSTTFGRIATKAGHRTFQARLRLSF